MGVDPVTGKPVYLTETVRGTDKAAHKKANSVLNRLLTQVESQCAPSSTVTFGYTLDEWLPKADIEDDTREMYRGYIERSM
ncbi:hypothetical protein [Crossiella sp. CA198]|uniref:hypothetical protein n=1 Tax=Crossiella sp. CA198 TaxID=3455607 RepID=UPI003F8D3846